MSLERKMRQADQIFLKSEKMSSELFTLTYGAFVIQLLKDYESAEAVNTQLDLIGYKIGQRLIEEYFAKTQYEEACHTFRETAEAIAKIGLRIFLGITADVKGVVQDPKSGVKQYSIVFKEYPLMDYVELPPQYKNELWYGNVLAGVIRGCLDIVQFRCSCQFIRCMLRGDDANEIQITLKEITMETPQDDEN